MLLGLKKNLNFKKYSLKQHNEQALHFLMGNWSGMEQQLRIFSEDDMEKYNM